MTERNSRRRRVRLLLALALLGATTGLGGCASSLVDNQMPVGIGADVNTLKKSPCACMPVPNLARSLG